MPTAAEYEARIHDHDWDGLRSLWQAMVARDTPGWEPGKAFEYLVLRTFELDGAGVRWPYTVRLEDEVVEEIDGAVHGAGLSLLVESKDLSMGRVSPVPIAKMRNQLLRRPSGIIGMVFSRTGFTEPARLLAQFTAPQSILLWNGLEVEFALEQERIVELLVLKYRGCVEEGIPDLNVVTGGV